MLAQADKSKITVIIYKDDCTEKIQTLSPYASIAFPVKIFCCSLFKMEMQC
jgi:hypothetical protein